MSRKIYKHLNKTNQINRGEESEAINELKKEFWEKYKERERNYKTMKNEQREENRYYQNTNFQ